MAGELRGRRFDLPPTSITRPTSDRVREATFNALDSLDAVRGARVVDPFAGSGALGIEALSRGATHATFAERDPAARAVLGSNVATLGLADRATVVPGDGSRALAGGGPWDLVLLDPPYGFDEWDELLVAVVAHLASTGVAVVESDREIALPGALQFFRTKQYGGTVVAFASVTGAPS